MSPSCSTKLPNLLSAEVIHGLLQTSQHNHFNAKLRDELLNGEVFSSLRKAQVLIEKWRRHYNRVRPHSSLGYRPPAPEAIPMARSQISS